MPLELFSLIVDDYDSAIGFFTGALGFELVEDSPAVTTEGRQKRWVVVRPADGGPGLLLARADGADQVAAIGRQFAGRVGLFLRVQDFEGTLDRVVRAGCDLVRPPREEAYGRVCVFRDPWEIIGTFLAGPPEGAVGVGRTDGMQSAPGLSVQKVPGVSWRRRSSR